MVPRASVQRHSNRKEVRTTHRDNCLSAVSTKCIDLIGRAELVPCTVHWEGKTMKHKRFGLNAKILLAMLFSMSVVVLLMLGYVGFASRHNALRVGAAGAAETIN